MVVIRVLVHILLIISALVLVASVLMQQGNSAGLGAIAGGAETFFGKNKAKGFEGKLALITKVCAAAFVVLAIVKVAIG
jgi:preprotein translocase subunit SecG